jgi:hypothetical protein
MDGVSLHPRLPAAIFIGVVLKTSLAFEAAVFKNLLFRRHSF